MPIKDQTKTPAKAIARFIKRHLEGGESVTALAKEFKVSRAGAYLWLRRHRDEAIIQSMQRGLSAKSKDKAEKMTLRAENQALKKENAKLRSMVMSLLIKTGGV
jgi:transposase-like protein